MFANKILLTDYPTRRCGPNTSLLKTANDKYMKRYGIRDVLIELVTGLRVWLTFIVCDVAIPILSIRMLKELGFSTVFGDKQSFICIPDHDVKIPFEMIDRQFLLTPKNIVPYVEAMRELEMKVMPIDNPTDGKKPTRPIAGTADYWETRADSL